MTVIAYRVIDPSGEVFEVSRAGLRELIGAGVVRYFDSPGSDSILDLTNDEGEWTIEPCAWE